MRDLNETNVTEAVLGQMRASDPRLQTLVESLVRHLHAFAREVELTEGEWLAAIRFLTAVGQISDDQRQEFILLSDVLGLSGGSSCSLCSLSVFSSRWPSQSCRCS